MNEFPKALIDCSSGKCISLLLNGEIVPGVIRIDNISNSMHDECPEITLTIVASELKKKGLNGKITEV